MARIDDWPEAPMLVGERLLLEPLRPEHADELAPLLDDEALHTFIGGERPRDALRDRYTRRSSAGRRRVAALAQLGGAPTSRRSRGRDDPGHSRRADGALIGEVAWVIGVPHQRQGYAREAASTMVTWLRDPDGTRASRCVRTCTDTTSMACGRLTAMALSPDDFYAHALAATDEEDRLPLSRMTGWEIAPFDQDGLKVAPLRPPVVPEPPRHGEDPADCRSCARRDEGIWFDDHWRLTRIGGVGVPLVLMLHRATTTTWPTCPTTSPPSSACSALTSAVTSRRCRTSRAAHVYRVGDGGAHLHIWFFARPHGQAQLYGSWLPVWDDLLPEYPADLAQADAEAVVRALVAS